MSNTKIQNTLFNFFTKIKDPNDDLVHQLADKLGIEHSALEKEIYELLSSLLYNGKYNEQKRKDGKVPIDKGQFEKGVKIEMEHTSNELLAQRIALDHLTEIVDYYDRLEKMEKGAHE